MARLKRRLKPVVDSRRETKRRASYGMTQSDFDPEQLRVGTLREMEEHGLLADTAMRIAMDHLAEDPNYYARAENPRQELYIYPNKSSIKAAERGLRAREKAPKSKKGGLDAMQAAEQGIGSGVLRARDIIAGKRVNAYQVKAFFDRHRGNYVKAKADGKRAEESKAIQAWLIWGGDPLYRQATRAVEAHRAGRKVPYQDKPKPNPRKKAKKKTSAKAKAKRAAKKVKEEARELASTKSGRTGIGAVAGAAILGVPGAIAGAVVGSRSKAPKENPSTPFRTREHDWNQVLISHAGKRMTRRQILRYYKRNRDKIWPFLEGQTVIVVLAPKVGSYVLRRKGPDGKYIKLTKLEGMDDPHSFEYWIHRRAIEFHPVLMKTTTPLVWVDVDPNPGRTRGTDAKALDRKAKRAIPKIEQVLRDEFGVRDAHVWRSGKRGYHVEACPPRPVNVNDARIRLRAALDEAFEGDESFTTSTPQKGQIRLDTTGIKTMGSIRAPYSLTVTGQPKKPV